jgi:phage gp29-like protein
MAEIGYQSASGLASWGVLAEEQHESNPDLRWPASIEVFDRMRSEDSQVGSVLGAVTLPIRSAVWQIDPAGARPEVAALVAHDLGLPLRGQETTPPIRTAGRFSWREHLRLALLELVYGHSFFEQVYEPDGSVAHLKKLAWRPPRTISNIEIADDGGLVAIDQWGTIDTPGAVRIPVDRLVAYVNDREGGNWVGRSLLRTAYKNWLLKDRVLRAQALGVERNSLGIPVYTGAPAPDSAQGTEREAWLKSEKDGGLKLATGLRAGASAGASIPNGAKLELVGVTGTLPDTSKPIDYHDQQIARAVLAHFLNLGTQTGSWALGSTFATFFTQSLNAVAQQIQDVTQQHVVEDLVDLNWGIDEPAPQLTVTPIGKDDQATAAAIQSLIQSGAVIPDEKLEAFMRARYGLPDADPETAREAPSTGGSNEPTGQAAGA